MGRREIESSTFDDVDVSTQISERHGKSNLTLWKVVLIFYDSMKKEENEKRVPASTAFIQLDNNFSWLNHERTRENMWILWTRLKGEGWWFLMRIKMKNSMKNSQHKQSSSNDANLIFYPNNEDSKIGYYGENERNNNVKENFLPSEVTSVQIKWGKLLRKLKLIMFHFFFFYVFLASLFSSAAGKWYSFFFTLKTMSRSA